MSAKKQSFAQRTGFTTRKILYFVIALLLFSAIVSILFTANAGENRAAQFLRGAFEGKGVVQDGTLEIEGMDPIGEIPEGEIRYFIQKKLVFPNGYAKGDVLLQNPETCGYALQFRFYLADGSSNVPVYTSPVLRPGQYMDGDKLDRYLSAGKYECTYSVTAYELSDSSVEYGSDSGFLQIMVVS